MAFTRVLVANRGEIAVRIIRAAHALGIETVQVVSKADADSMPARLASRTVVIGASAARQSYLDERLIVHAALASGCDALHPGYGFLAERAELAQLCADNGIVFIGPRPETIGALGDKLRARETAAAANVPLIPGTDRVTSVSAARRAAETLTYPVLMKASAGGGGRGMFVARGPHDVDASFDKAGAEAEEAFGDGTLYLERYVENARHVEVQVLGDGTGRVVHFGERDCSIQRRYQKVIEESPCTVMPDDVRKRLHGAAVDLVASLNYLNAGTVEFLYDLDRRAFYFMEVNARIQVEHPVTEQVTGTDLVQLQFKIAAGEPLTLRQEQITVDRHAIECRINAENPDRDFLPCPGRIERWAPPAGAGIRIDSHCTDDYAVPPFYDSLIAKLVVTANDRSSAVARLARALECFRIDGLTTNLPLLRFIARHPEFDRNQFNTRWLEHTLLPAFEQRTEFHPNGTY